MDKRQIAFELLDITDRLFRYTKHHRDPEAYGPGQYTLREIAEQMLALAERALAERAEPKS